MAGKKRRTGRTRLTVLDGNGTMRSAPAPRRDSPTSIDGLPTRVYFTRGSSTPTSNSLTVLRKYAEWLARNRARRLFVVGHANRRNWAQTSAALADARVRAVRDLLV
jgi:outer membrane protein OmpA-like peptidoglycan-associated protein